MAAVNIQATFCNTGTGAHATAVTLRIGGVVQGVYPSMEFADLQLPVDEAEKKLFVRLFLQLHLIGKTPAQLRSDMQAGITATI